MDSMRSKNQFDFESDDNDFPYVTDKYDVGSRRVTAFSYSPEFFRRKKSTGLSGVYQVFGGNIPSDMADTETFYFKNASSTPPPPLVCNLNKGTAERIRPIKFLNLSPNFITPTLDLCETAPTNPEINYELGVNQKPNHMYLGVFQASASTHPRASGYAHEDNYNCLKTYRGLSITDGRYGSCCNDLVNTFATHGTDVFSVGQQTTPITIKRTNPITKEITYEIGAVVGINCVDPKWEEEVKQCRTLENRTGCQAGFVIKASLVPYGEKGDLGGVSKYRDCKTITDGTPENTISLAEAYLSIIFKAEGNTDCGCSGHYKDIKIVGYDECVRCVYEKWNGRKMVGFANNETYKCSFTSINPTTWCHGLFVSKYDTEDQNNGELWVHPGLREPSTKFQNFKKLVIENGELISKDCAGEQLLTCNDVR